MELTSGTYTHTKNEEGLDFWIKLGKFKYEFKVSTPFSILIVSRFVNMVDFAIHDFCLRRTRK